MKEKKNASNTIMPYERSTNVRSMLNKTRNATLWNRSCIGSTISGAQAHRMMIHELSLSAYLKKSIPIRIAIAAE
jgi:hypothetical protein